MKREDLGNFAKKERNSAQALKQRRNSKISLLRRTMNYFRITKSREHKSRIEADAGSMLAADKAKQNQRADVEQRLGEQR